jgi:lipopolysaccharide transport system permease protein
MAGLLAWTLFSEIIGRCLNLFIEQGNLMKKMSFPRITLPTVVVGSCLLNNVLLLISMLGIFLILGQQFSLYMLWLIPLTLVVISLALGIGLILGVMNVFVRDIGQVTPIVLQTFFWFTPIVYPISILPVSYRHLLAYNPMQPLVSGYQEILVYGRAPQLDGLLVISLISVGLLLLSLFIFRRASEEMVDSL